VGFLARLDAETLIAQPKRDPESGYRYSTILSSRAKEHKARSRRSYEGVGHSEVVRHRARIGSGETDCLLSRTDTWCLLNCPFPCLTFFLTAGLPRLPRYAYHLVSRTSSLPKLKKWRLPRSENQLSFFRPPHLSAHVQINTRRSFGGFSSGMGCAIHPRSSRRSLSPKPQSVRWWPGRGNGWPILRALIGDGRVFILEFHVCPR